MGAVVQLVMCTVTVPRWLLQHNKNALVREHYRNLGFDRVRLEEDGTAHWRLDLNRFEPFDVPIESVAYF